MENLFLMIPNMAYGGQERFVATLSEILKEDYDVTIIVFDDYKIGYEVSVPIIALPKPASKSLFSRGVNIIKKIIATKKLYNTYKPIGCLSFGNGANRFNALTRTSKMKSYISIRGYAAAKQYMKRLPDMLSVLRVDGVLCVSEEIKKYLSSRFPVSKLITSYNAYDVETIQVKGTQKKLSEEDGILHCITMGRVVNAKGYWHVIRAFKWLKENNVKAKLDIYGFDEIGDVEILKNFAQKLNVEEYICFCGHTSEVYETMGKYDVYLLSSVSEGFPNSLVEAMACGLPVIADDCLTGPREILYYSAAEEVKSFCLLDYGIITPRLNSKKNLESCELEQEEIEFARAIKYLVDNPLSRIQLSNAGKKRAKEFSYESCRLRFCNLLK